ncbi:flavodoxin-dependent (E)-4-hydroxy-3-methylbut-2-enyl-diphosphate synthase [Chloroflexota bacterium]
MNQRRKSQAVRIGSVIVGGDTPVVVQSMTKTDTRDVKATMRQIDELADAGCEIVRLAVPDAEAATAFGQIKKQSSLPLVADIHFDYRLALTVLKEGADGLRINPGNIGSSERVQAVVAAAKEREVPIRIGVNAGSLPANASKDLPLAEQMAAAAMEHVAILEALDYNLIKISVKAFDVPQTVVAYRIIAKKTPYPLHLGITEAGLPTCGMIRSAVGIGALLYLGIGDTIRVSLTGEPTEEVFAAYEILKSLNLRSRGATLVSCPTCGRTEADVRHLAEVVSKEISSLDKPIKVAVMGCEVNGPGEAKDADVGIACGKGRGVIFRKGKKVAVVEEKDFLDRLMQEINNL